MLVYEERGNRITRRKTSRSRVKNQQIHSHMASGNRNQARLVASECSHHFACPLDSGTCSLDSRLICINWNATNVVISLLTTRQPFTDELYGEMKARGHWCTTAFTNTHYHPPPPPPSPPPLRHPLKEQKNKNTTLFHHASHTQQKLVSRWGVGKHVTIKYIYKFKTEVYYIESVRSSRRHGGRGGKFTFEIRKRFCGLCLIGKIIPEHCTTILKAALQKTKTQKAALQKTKNKNKMLGESKLACLFICWSSSTLVHIFKHLNKLSARKRNTTNS